MKKLCLGNWKMCCSRETIANFDTSRAEKYSKVEIGIALPHVYISMGSEKFGEHIALCAQDCSQFTRGAYTGEVGAYMLKELGVKYVILGHSERRHALKESDSVIQNKLRCCLAIGLDVVLCVGETLDDKENGQTIAVVEKQLEILRNFKECGKIIIAYEPVWAIGTGMHADRRDIENVIVYVRKASESHGHSTRVLYGGSVTKENCEELTRVRGLDGFLIGSASMTTDLFDIADVLEQ